LLCAFNLVVAGYNPSKRQKRQDSSYVSKRCVVCNEPFDPKGPAQKSCSPKCARIHTANKRKGIEPQAEAPSFGCRDCLVHGRECEELFPTETAAKVGCNPLDFPEPVFA
jgi:hypothetical protein